MLLVSYFRAFNVVTIHSLLDDCWKYKTNYIVFALFFLVILYCFVVAVVVVVVVAVVVVVIGNSLLRLSYILSE